MEYRNACSIRFWRCLVLPSRRLRRRWLLVSARREVLRAATTGSWFWRIDDGLVGLSEEASNLAGAGPKFFDSTPDAALALVHREDRETVLAAVLSTFQYGDEFRVDVRLEKAQARPVWVHLRGRLVVDPVTGARLAVVGSVQDVTEHKRNEDAIRNSEQRYRAVLESSPDTVLVVGADGRIAEASNEVFNLLGYRPGEIVGRRADELLERFPAPDPAPGSRLRTRATALELNAVRRDGTKVSVEVAVSAMRTGDGCVIASIRDTSERRRSEEAVRASQRRLAEAQRLARVGSWTWNTTTRETDWSPEMARILGVSRDQMNVERFIGLVHPEDRDKVRQTIIETVRSGTAFKVEYRLITPSGKIKWLEGRGEVVGRTEDELVLQGTVQDVTEVKRAAERMALALRREREAAERLRALDGMKDAFLEAVSHELRTPLAALLGLSLTIEHAHPTLGREQMIHMAGRMVANAQRLDTLITDLLDLDRITRGVLEARRQPTDMRALVDSVISHVHLTGRQIELEVEPLTADVDPAQVERIVENLVVNAVRHTPLGTRMILSVRREGGGVLVRLDDAGPGVPEHLRNRIFLPFERGDGEWARARGTGIGLSLVARFADLHGGKAWVADSHLGGASFCVWLPERAVSQDEVA